MMAAVPQESPPTKRSSAAQSLECKDFKMTLSESDLDALRPGEWVTDDVIDFYFRYLKHRYFRNNKKYVYMPMNLANLLTARTVESTSRYIRELTNDANEIDYQTQCLRKPRGIKVAFIPIFGDGHWSLLVYRVKTRSRLPEFLHFNSYLNSTRANHTQCARQALINLLYVFRANDPAMVISHDTYKLVIKNCPQQSNGNDCGVYVCMYAYILSARLARENEGRRNAFQNIFHRLTSSTTAQAAADREGPDRLLYSTKNARKDAPVDPEDQLWRIKEVAQADEMRGYIVKVINRATVSSRRSRSANL